MFNLYSILIGVPITLLALTVHEYAHGYVSNKLGDPTPLYQNRLTLNPFAHLDIMGTILMILTGFGWAKPVEVNPRYYKNPMKGMALVAAAGPISNFLLACVGLIIGTALEVLFYKLEIYYPLDFISMITEYFIFRNLCFAIFNLIPIPPLDGFKIAGYFLPSKIYYQLLRYEQYILFLVMALSLTGAFSYTIGTAVRFIADLMYKAVDIFLVNFVV